MRNILAAVALLALPAAQASAHAFLKTASPAVGSTVSSPPRQVVIDFTEAVEPSFSTITVQNAQGAHIATGMPHLTGSNSHLAVTLDPLPPGTYTVLWHATATDTHKTQGSFKFTVAPQ